VTGATLPLTGSDTAMPLAVALGLLLSGGAAVGLTSRRRDEVDAETE
jgi:LPXTG-motif cell wall-anchored protein